jgi:hypothetical protein
MSELNINVEDIKEPPTVTEGAYRARVDSIDFVMDDGKPKTDKNGNRYLAGSYRITEEGAFQNRVVKDNYIAVEGDNAVKFKRLATACGLPGVIRNTAELVGKELTIQVRNELYDGRVTAKVDGYLA